MKPNAETPCRKGGEGREPPDQERRRRLRRAPGLADRLGSRGGGRGCALMAGGSKKFRRFAVKLHRGRCEVCGMPIQRARLEALPTARTRVECQRVLEREPWSGSAQREVR